jgi:hypothetical protein
MPYLEHDAQPMIVLDPTYQIFAAITAYQRQFGVAGQPHLGHKCYHVSDVRKAQVSAFAQTVRDTVLVRKRAMSQAVTTFQSIIADLCLLRRSKHLAEKYRCNLMGRHHETKHFP